jgi:hypothetical protein
MAFEWSSCHHPGPFVGIMTWRHLTTTWTRDNAGHPGKKMAASVVTRRLCSTAAVAAVKTTRWERLKNSRVGEYPC